VLPYGILRVPRVKLDFKITGIGLDEEKVLAFDESRPLAFRIPRSSSASSTWLCPEEHGEAIATIKDVLRDSGMDVYSFTMGAFF
jgi:hypothetical protein